jgi:hypothetical protein
MDLIYVYYVDGLENVENIWFPRVEASPITSTVALLVAGGDEKGTRCLEVYNWTTLFLGDINRET